MDEDVVQSNPTGSRPYRSHLQPACDECRRRRARCITDGPGEACQLCRAKQVACHFASAKRKTRTDGHVESESVTTKRRPAEPRSRLAQLPSVNGTSPTESSLLLNPIMAEDVDVLERYLTAGLTMAGVASKPYNTISSKLGDPIIYLTVPRHRKGLQSTVQPGRVPREILEQILGPFKTEVIALFFRHIQPCFPVLDEKIFSDLWQRHPERISSTLVCEIYASALLFWDRSELLRQHPRPDLVYAWNQAVAALEEDYMAPTISTVHAALIDMIGRPVFGVTGNIVNNGRTSTLAASLGLHRDPTSWKATSHEKNLRIRLWWGVLIHDRWSSFAHGTPPAVNAEFYDVPIPTFESLVAADASEPHKMSTSSFSHLCSLTEILGRILPLVYSLKTDDTDFWRILRRLECSLDDWEETLPRYLNLTASAPEEYADGSSSLWFCFLSTKLLLGRLAFRATLNRSEDTMKEAKQYRLAILRHSACTLVDYVISLDAKQLHGFWLPYTSHLLVSAATTLLRCTIEAGGFSTKESAIVKLESLKRRLAMYRDDLGWELGNFCLERCGDAMSKLARTIRPGSEVAVQREAPPPVLESINSLGNAHSHTDHTPISDGDFLLPVDSLDYPWETLWDSFEGPWQIRI